MKYSIKTVICSSIIVCMWLVSFSLKAEDEKTEDDKRDDIYVLSDKDQSFIIKCTETTVAIGILNPNIKETISHCVELPVKKGVKKPEPNIIKPKPKSELKQLDTEESKDRGKLI